MSIDATRWAYQQTTGSSSKKAVLVSMADRCGEDFTCYPSIARLCKDTELNRKTVMKAIDDLQAQGFIQFTGEYRGNGVKVYRLVGVIGRDNDIQTSTNFGTSAKNGTSTNFGTSTSTNFTTPSTKNGTSTSTNFGTQNHHRTINEPIIEPSLVDGQRISPTKNSNKRETKKPQFSYQPPSGLQPTPKQISDCQTHGINPYSEFENFIDWAIANGKGYVDWSRGFSTWIKNSISWQNQALANKKPSNQQQLQALANSFGDNFYSRNGQ